MQETVLNSTPNRNAAQSLPSNAGLAVLPALRILHVISSLAPKLGGSVECAKQITIALADNSCEVELVCVDPPESDWLTQFKVNVHALGAPALKLFYSPSLDLARWLITNVQRFDIVICHGIWQFHSVATGIACKRAGVPYLVYSHGMLMRNSLLGNRVKLAKKALYWALIERAVLNGAASLLYTSESERQWSNVKFFRTSCVATNIGNGIAGAPQFSSLIESSMLVKQSRPTLLALGRLHPVKGLDTLLNALALLGDAAPNVVVAGTGTRDYERYLRELAASLGVSAWVQFVGEVAGEKKWHLLSTSWALVAPSLHENFGLAIVEALSIGTPAIVTKNVGIWREIDASGAGIAYQGGAEELAQSIRSFFALPSSAHAHMGVRASECFESNFSISVPTTRLITLIQRVIGEHK